MYSIFEIPVPTSTVQEVLEEILELTLVIVIVFNPFNSSCSKLLLFEGFNAILV